MNLTSRQGTGIDLHVHTTASDGTLSPRDLVREAQTREIRYLGITDHDSTEGLAEAIDEASSIGSVTVIPGVELSATSVAGGDLHLLGYCIDPGGSALQRALDEFRRSREARVERMVRRLRENDVPITLEQVETKAAGGAVSRAHLGRVLIDLGVVETIDQAFAQWLGRGRPGFVPREPLFAGNAVDLVREAGGVAVLAHPLTMGDFRRQLPELVEAGMVGIEVYYGPYSPEQRSELARVAREFGLIATGGSDYHGPEHREGRDLGGVDVPLTVIDELRRHAPGCA